MGAGNQRDSVSSSNDLLRILYFCFICAANMVMVVVWLGSEWPGLD